MTSLKPAVKAIAKRSFPALFARIQSVRAARQRRRLADAIDLPRIMQSVTATTGLVVADGPFAGMQYVHDAARWLLLPKLIGSYECELHPAIREFISGNFQTVVNVGCAEGYYAVGLARAMPAVRVYAFDSDPAARDLCRRLSARNGVSDRLIVEGECRAARLNEVLRGPAFLIMDCEGCEDVLLDPKRVPNLRTAGVIVECHDFAVPDVSSRICERFRATHSIELIPTRPRKAAGYPPLQSFSPGDQALALSEFRPAPQQWAVLRPAPHP